ncbi:hypothetical protein NLI96_g3492 [Meripilus lineatus]|uniref:NAD(P)-binding protein n=1 Tax=Meripilus lineatus TaxID=2056292 RepID=A0AAD5YJ14_9APHY|nr:hypothetical protein NLI96_g3492 [Physisporinus lineatus]
MVTQVALVTGSAQGIGEAIALRFARDGIDVALLDIHAKQKQLEGIAKKIEAEGRRALVILADVSQEEEVKGAVDKTVETLGGLDIMVANAAVLSVGGILELPSDEWKRVQAVNVEGVMYCYKYAAIQMVKQGRGGRILGMMNAPAYSTSKFAIRGLTQAVAKELLPHKITVNTYAPGLIATPMCAHPDDAINGGYVGATIKKFAGLPNELEIAEPSVIADFVAYLVRPEAYYITGEVVSSFFMLVVNSYCERSMYKY